MRPMAPTHQPVPHRQQMVSIPAHQHLHHVQHHPANNPRMIMGVNPQNHNVFRHIILMVMVVCIAYNTEATKIHQPRFLDKENLELVFGPSGCFEGTLKLVNVGIKDNQIIQNSHNLNQQQQQSPTRQKNEQKNNVTIESHGETKDSGTSNQQSNATNANLANTREKTPMCLVNELARFNKIQHQYRLTNEQGPAHKKRFTVTLMLGEEEYVSEGASIKKAQHSAASEALSKTWYRKPPPKPTRTTRIPGKCPAGSGGHLPPTVELNALAMKRGEATVYTFRHAPPASAGPQQFVAPGYPNYQRIFNPRYPSYNRGYEPQGIYLVTLKVGDREFIGRGMTGQAARHDAASRALEQLRQLPLPEEISSTTNTTTENGQVSSNNVEDPNSELKSPVSLVHETALKRGSSVTFDVVSETGKPHIRTFMTRCSVGDKVTHGEGSSKKISKKRAAELMLEELKNLPPVVVPIVNKSIRVKRKPPTSKKKSRNLIKVYQEPRTETETSEDVNPISRLVQIQQAKREKEPIYNLIEEKGAPRRREFVMEVSIGETSAQGIGPNKKLAKRVAAETLLNNLGYSKPQPVPAKSSIKTNTENKENSETKTRKVTFLENDTVNETHSHPTGGSIGRQLVPGLLLVDSGQEQKVSGPSVHAVAEELRGQQTPQSSGVSPKDQLNYLAQLLNFEVQFSDFPKGTYKEFLSLVSLSTDPPQVCHGHGPTKSASRDQAALTALRTLSKLGLDSVTNSNKKEKSSPGENIHNYNQINSNVINGALEK